jgi:hypothetical protein
LGGVKAVSLDTVIWLLASVAEAAVIALLLYRRVWRNFPIFFAYSIEILAWSATGYLILHSFPRTSSIYVTAYFVDTIVDSVLLFGILVELAWSILRPVRSSLPRGAIVAIALLIVALGAAIWPFAAFPGAAHMLPGVALVMRLQQTFSILRVLVFLALAGFSQLLSIGWRDRELQIATGLGFDSLIGLVVVMLHAHQSTWTQYANLNEVAVGGYLCSLLYWIVSFSQKEAERREFTPQMQSMLLAVAGSARSTRVAMAKSAAAETEKQKGR